MKHLLICMLGILCSTPLTAVEALLPETFLTHTGTFASTNGTILRELTIETNKLWFKASAGQQSTSAGSYNWVAAPHWFVYVGKDFRVWAFNGQRFFILLEADSTVGRTVPYADLKEQPPAPVVKRLPKAMRKP